jgi:phosphate transport system substrate-binding protein
LHDREVVTLVGHVGGDPLGGEGVVDDLAQPASRTGQDQRLAGQVVQRAGTLSDQAVGGVVGIGNDWVGKTISDVTISGRGNNLVLDLSKVYATTTPGAYPILLASYELVCSKYPDAQAGKAVKAFMQSTVTAGQQGLTPLGYIPLPADFQTKVAAAVNAIS